MHQILLLKPAERTQKSTDKSPQQNTKQYQYSGDIVRKLEFRRPYNCLKCPDGTRACCSRTRIAIQSRHTGVLFLSPIQRTIQKIWKMNVCQKSCHCLNPTSKSCKKMHFLFVTLFYLSQFQHTPYTIELPLKKLFVLRHARCQRRALQFQWAKEALAQLLFLMPFVSLLWFDDTSIHHTV